MGRTGGRTGSRSPGTSSTPSSTTEYSRGSPSSSSSTRSTSLCRKCITVIFTTTSRSLKTLRRWLNIPQDTEEILKVLKTLKDSYYPTFCQQKGIPRELYTITLPLQ